MKERIKCECLVDCGASRVRGWHNTAPCSRPAKWLVKYIDGKEAKVCGIHKKSIEYHNTWNKRVETIIPLTQSK